MKTIHQAVLALALAVAGTTSAYAHGSVDFSISIGAPAYYYERPSVVYVPPPAVYYEPAPIYYRYYSPVPYVRYYYEPRYREYRRHDWDRGRHRHGWHDDDD